MSHVHQQHPSKKFRKIIRAKNSHYSGKTGFRDGFVIFRPIFPEIYYLYVALDPASYAEISLPIFQKMKYTGKFECTFWRENSNCCISGFRFPIFTKFYGSTQLGDPYTTNESAFDYRKQFKSY